MQVEFEKAAGYIEKEITLHMKSISKMRRGLWINVWVMAFLAVIMHFATYMSVQAMVSGFQQILAASPDKLKVEGDTIKVVAEQIGYGHIVLTGFLVVLVATLFQIKNENSIIKDLRAKKSKIYQLSILSCNDLSDNYDLNAIVQCLVSGEEPTSDISPTISVIESGINKVADAIKGLKKQ